MKLKLFAVSLVLLLMVCLAVGCTTGNNTTTDTETFESESFVVEETVGETADETDGETESELESESEFESETETETETDNVTLRFGVMSDTHIGATVGDNMNRALGALKGISGDKLDLMLFSGDLTDTVGSTVTDDQIKTFRSKYNREMEGTPFVFCLGSTHDLPAQSGATRPTTLETIRGLYKDTLGNFDYDLAADAYVDAGVRHAVMNGYHVFAVDYLATDAALSQMVTEMQALTAEDPDKPIFAILHNPAESHVTSLFADFPQVICFSGHYHNSSAREDSIKQDGGYTQVHIGGTAYYRVDGYNRFNTSNPFLNLGNIYKFAQSLYVEVADDNTVTITRVDGYTGKTFGEPWVITPERRDVYTDARKETAEPCTFPDDAAIEIYEGGSAVQVVFDGATMGDAGPALYYNISLLEKNNQGQYVVVQTADVGSQQVFYPNDEGIPEGHYTHTFRGVTISDYAIVIRAVDCWQTSTDVLVYSTGGYQHGVGNVALGKRVTITPGASLEGNPEYGAAMLTDGLYGYDALHPTKLRGWLKPDGNSVPESFIISEDNPVDIVIDLGDLYDIDTVRIFAITNFNYVFPTYFEIQVSATEDGDDWVTVHVGEDVVCGKRLGSGDSRETYDAYPESDRLYNVALDEVKTARRVRVHITEPSVATVGDDCYMGFGEIELWGKPADN